MKDKKAYYGLSGWINNLKVNRRKVSLLALVNTINIVNIIKEENYPQKRRYLNKFYSVSEIDDNIGFVILIMLLDKMSVQISR